MNSNEIESNVNRIFENFSKEEFPFDLKALLVSSKFILAIPHPHILWLTILYAKNLCRLWHVGFVKSGLFFPFHHFIKRFMHCIQFGNVNTAAMCANHQFIFTLLNGYIMHRHTGQINTCTHKSLAHIK